MCLFLAFYVCVYIGCVVWRLYVVNICFPKQGSVFVSVFQSVFFYSVFYQCLLTWQSTRTIELNNIKCIYFYLLEE